MYTDFKITLGYATFLSNKRMTCEIWESKGEISKILTARELNVSLPKFIYWNLLPSVMVLGGGAFGQWLGHESRFRLVQLSLPRNVRSW